VEDVIYLRKKITFKDCEHIILIAIMIAWKILPFFSYRLTGTTWSIAYHIVFLMWLLLTFTTNGVWFKVVDRYMFSFILWILYLSVSFLIFPNTQIGFLSLSLSFWEPVMIYYYYTKIYANERVKYLIAAVGILIILFGIFVSARSVQTNALAAREASSGHNSEDALLTGNYAFTAMITILIPAMLSIVIKIDKVFIRIISILFIAGTVFFIMKCSLTISIICLMVTFILFPIISTRPGITVKHILIVTLVILGVFLLFSNIVNLLINVLNGIDLYIDSYVVSERIATLKTLLMTGTMTGDLNGRINLSLVALKTFLSNPIIGIGPQNNANIYFRTYLGFHATLFDDIARYGIVGMMLYFNVYRHMWKLSTSMLSGISFKAYKCGFYIFVIISMLNPTTSAEIGFALFLVMPALCEWICIYSEKYGELKK